MPNPLTSNFKAQFRQDLNDELLDLAGITITLIGKQGKRV